MNIQMKEEQEEMIWRLKKTDSRVLSWLFTEKDNSCNNVHIKNSYNDKVTPINVDFFHSSIQ